MSLVERVRKSIDGALGRFLTNEQQAAAAGCTSWNVERPKRAEHGDYATNVAMVLTRIVGMPPRTIAEKLVEALNVDAVIKSAEIAGPGFVNLRLHPRAVHEELAVILAQGKDYGRGASKTKERIDVEFVSANPTGPITVAAARNGIFGDAVCTLLELTGNTVTREYYINDFGNQIKAFATSVRKAHEGKERVEGEYQGAYVDEIARYLETRTPDPFLQDDTDLSRTCITAMLHGIPGSTTLPGIRKSLGKLGIHHDVWFSEESLHRWGAVDVGIEQLRKGGFLVEKEGATFFVMPQTEEEKAKAEKAKAEKAKADKPKDDKKKHGDEDDGRVVKKADGNWTYFASDIAYHSDKLSRGYDRIIDVLGADHHGYIPRMRNVMSALGLPASKCEFMIYQLVNILRNGEIVKSSKRAGSVITSDEVIDEIDEAAGREGAGRDAIRYFFLSRSANTTVDFDLEIAKKKSLDNPVFYVQYGHARLSSILKKAESIGVFNHEPATIEAWAKLDNADELALAMSLARWPETLAEAAALREPHRIVFYLQELGRDFQSYFTRMKNDPILPKDSTRAEADWLAKWDSEKTIARLGWVRAIRAVYATALSAIGVSAPDRMDLPQTAEDGDAAATEAPQ